MPITGMWLTVLLLAALSTACGSGTSGNAEDYVGEYVFKPTNADPGNFASFVILKRDQTVVEVRFAKDTGQVSITEEKRWYLSHTTQQNVSIGGFSHPVEPSGSLITLGINDLGHYYEKVR